MTHPAFDITPFLHQDEGQHFDRKFLFEGPEGTKRTRDRRAVRDQVAEYVAGFANLRSLIGLDTLNASLLLRRLRDRSLLELHPHGANSYYTLPPPLSEATDRGERDADRGDLAQDRGERDADRGELAPEILAAIGQLGTRPRKERLRAVIATICARRDWTTPAELARWLNILPANLTDRHLSPMVKAGQLERRFPDTPTHAEQAYRSADTQFPLGLSEEDEP